MWAGLVRIAPLVGTTVLVAAYAVEQYLSGAVTDRQFMHGQASLGGGLASSLAGGYVGLKTGAVIGAGIESFFGPGGTVAGAGIGGTIGAFGGGLTGSYAGAHLAGSGVDRLFQLQDAEQHERYVQFVLRHYQLP
jgi:hypothetical protein